MCVDFCLILYLYNQVKFVTVSPCLSKTPDWTNKKLCGQKIDRGSIGRPAKQRESGASQQSRGQSIWAQPAEGQTSKCGGSR